METIAAVLSIGSAPGHGVAAFQTGPVDSTVISIGDQQSAMALRACRGADATQPAVRTDLTCLHCGAEMHLLEDCQIGSALHLSALCPRCGCLRATYVELSPTAQRFQDLPQEASFD